MDKRSVDITLIIRSIQKCMILLSLALLIYSCNHQKSSTPISLSSSKISSFHDKRLVLSWGTFDTVIQNDQTLAVWVKVENPNDTGAIKIPFPLEKYQLWINTADTAFMLWSWLDGDNWYPAKTSVYSILKIETYWGLPRIEKSINAKLTIKTTPAFEVINPEFNVRLQKPENFHLANWFRQADSLLKCPNAYGSTITSKSGNSNWNNRGLVHQFLYEKCEYLTKWLDSLRLNHLDSGIVHANAKRLLGNKFCQDGFGIDDISMPNWPYVRAEYKCRFKENMNTPESSAWCYEQKRKFNEFLIQLAHLTSQIPGDFYHKYKFNSKNGIVYLDRTSWIDSISNEFEQ